MLIAVASQNFRTITPHAGKSRRFMIFSLEPGRPPHELDRLDLPKDMSIHEYKGEGRHPLHEVDVVIAGSAGRGFVARMAAFGVQTLATAETNPARAVELFAAGSLPPPAPEDDEGGCDCDCHAAH
jgi:predicted Fe-Mo cluster-binding NifX family protein